MENLNKDILIKLSLDLDLPSLYKLCKSSKRFNEIICKNDVFWRKKLISIGIKNVNRIREPKEAYKQITNKKDITQASYDGNIYRVKYLIEYENVKPADNAILFASQNNHFNVVKYLVEHGANVNPVFYEEDEDGNLDEIEISPLIEAVTNNHLNLVKYLIYHGANVNAYDDIALHFAIINGNLKMVKFLIKHGANNGYDALISAIERNHLEILKFLVDKGANIHANDDYALVRASAKGNLEIVKFLVENGANINDDALFAATRNKHLKVVEYLKERNRLKQMKINYYFEPKK